jgi:hypothetical protein
MKYNATKSYATNCCAAQWCATATMACLLAGTTAFAQPASKNSASTSQWSKTEGTMADFVSQGYTITAVTRSAEGTSVQEINTSFYLTKGTSIIKCGDGYRPRDSWSYVAACSKLVQPFDVGRNPN